MYQNWKDPEPPPDDDPELEEELIFAPSTGEDFWEGKT